MALPPNFLDEVRARTPLAALIGRRTRLVRNGRNWKACCPFHGEKTPSFYVYDDHYHCFGCGVHGDAIRFVMETEGQGFREAVERLAAEAGLEVPKESPRQAEQEARRRDLHEVLEAAAAVMARRLREPDGRPALEYLRGRGLDEGTIGRFGLGWSGGGRGALAAELRPLGIEPAQLVEAGLMKQPEGSGAATDFFFNRVMFPIRDRRGRLCSFGGRILGDGQPKYLNGPETAVFSKRRTLYGLEIAREAVFRRGARLVAVEGYMDVIALHQAGFEGAVAPLGTALTEEQLEDLWRVSPEPVLCFDADAAGARAAARTVELALPLLQGPERTLRVLSGLGSEAKDPDELIRERGAAAFAAALDGARPLSEALFDLKDPPAIAAGPEAWAGFKDRLMEAAAAIPSKSLASEYRRVLLDRFFAARPRGGPKPGAAATPWTPRGPGGRGDRRGAPFRPPPRILRTPIVEADAQVERARCLVAILLTHPALLGEVEEAFGELELPDERCAQLQSAMLAWQGGSHSLDSDQLLAHLTALGLGDAVAWVRAGVGRLEPARPDAPPAEALEGWWQYFGLLKGEDALLEDHHLATQAWLEATDPAAQERLLGRMVRLKQTIDAVRRGEPAGADTT